MNQDAYQAYDLNGHRKYLNGNEGTEFLKMAATLAQEQKLLCEALFFLGCRISEALQLKRDDIDGDASLIRVLCLKKRGKIVTRRIHIPKWLTEALLRLTPGKEGRLWPISRSTGWRIIKRVMALAGISGIQACPKGLRHGLGVRCVLAGTPLSLIQKMMGHARSVTTNIYIDVKDEEERALVAKSWPISIPPGDGSTALTGDDEANVTVKIEDEMSEEARRMALDSGLSISGWVSKLIRREVQWFRSARQKSLLEALGNEQLAEIEINFPRIQGQPLIPGLF